ncbi:MAG: sulfatase-like hydrolase/transferase [Burkholderiaceae bacterium]
MLGDYIGPGESPYTEYDRSITERTLEWLRDAAKRNDDGFVLYVGFVAPHFPLVVPQRFFDMYPADRLPAPKLNPADGYLRHPWAQGTSISRPASSASESRKAGGNLGPHRAVQLADENVGGSWRHSTRPAWPRIPT